MVNIISQHPNSALILALDSAHLHLYDKSEREGRKLGHITLTPNSSDELTALCRKLSVILPEPLALDATMQIQF